MFDHDCCVILVISRTSTVFNNANEAPDVCLDGGKVVSLRLRVEVEAGQNA